MNFYFIVFVLECTSRADVVFVLDSSGSVGRYNFDNVLRFVTRTISDLSIDSGNFRVGVVSFSDSARQEFYLNTYNNADDINKAIRGIRYVYGSTNTQDALRMVREYQFTQSNGDRPGKYL